MAVSPIHSTVIPETAPSRPGHAASAAQSSLTTIASSSATQISDYGRLRAAFDKLQSAASALSGSDGFASQVAVSSNPQVAGASARNVSSGTEYQIEVTQLAQRQSVVLASQISPNNPIGSGAPSTVQFDFGAVGNETLQVDATRSATVNIDNRNNTLNGIAQAINAADVGVLAEVVKANGQFQLQLTAEDSGAKNAFAVTVSGDTNLRAQLQFNPADAGPSAARVTTAQDAQFKLNGIAESSASNTLRETAPGIVIDLKRVGQTKLSVQAQSAGRPVELVSDFLNAVNGVQSQLQQAQALAPTPAFQDIRTDLNEALNRAERLAGSFGGLAGVGIRGSADAGYRLDTVVFQSALAVNRDGVASIFTRPDGSGIADQLAAAALNLSATTANEVSRLSAAARDAQHLRLGPATETVYGARLDTQFNQLGGLMQALNESDFTLSAQLAQTEAGRGGSTAQIKHLNGLANLLTPSN